MSKTPTSVYLAGLDSLVSEKPRPAPGKNFVDWAQQIPKSQLVGSTDEIRRLTFGFQGAALRYCPQHSADWWPALAHLRRTWLRSSRAAQAA